MLSDTERADGMKSKEYTQSGRRQKETDEEKRAGVKDVDKKKGWV